MSDMEALPTQPCVLELPHAIPQARPPEQLFPEAQAPPLQVWSAPQHATAVGLPSGPRVAQVEPEAQLQLPLLKMRGEGQFAVQEPDWQCSPEAHEWPQVPQLALLLSVLTHWPLQEVCPPEQPWHEPPTQVWPGPQETPQPPQLELVETSVHTPLQLFWPDGQGQHVDPQMY
jgi:hypothetical protein